MTKLKEGPMVPAESREDWLHARRAYLGGTDVASIVGKNKYKPPLAVYEEKVLGAPDTGSSESAEVGIALEPLCRIWFERDTGLSVLPASAHIRHPQYSFLGANPDGLVGESAIWENKTHGIRTAHEWGEEGTDEIPEAYHIQCVWYLGLTGRQVAYVMATDTGNWKRRHYLVHADPEYFDALVTIAARWWDDHVAKAVAPDPIGHPKEIDAIQRMYPRDNGELVIATPDLDEVAETYLDLSGRASAIEKEAAPLKARLIGSIGEASGLVTQVGNFTYKASADKPVTDWKACFEFVHGFAREGTDPIDAKYRKAMAQAIADFTTSKPGTRRFMSPRVSK